MSGLSGAIHGKKKSKLTHYRGLSRGKSDKQYTTLKTSDTGISNHCDNQIECAAKI